MTGESRADPVAPSRTPERIVAALVALTILALVALRITSVLDISAGAIIVISLRLVVPLLIFRSWLAGGIVAMLLDAADVILIDLIGLGGFGGYYAELDKVLDGHYYVIELLVALGWDNRWMTVPAVVLFAFRLVGTVIFEFTHDHLVLFLFPNMFEMWWLYCVVVMKWFPRLVPRDWRTVVVPLVILLVPKMGQEYLLHYAEAHPWDWTKKTILKPIGIDFS